MAKSLHILMFASIVIFFTLTSSREIDQYSQEVPEDVNISPTPDFDFYIESPDESPFEEEVDSPAMEYEMEKGYHYTDEQLDFLEVCFQKLSSSDCGDNIFKNMVYETTQILTNKCCRDILKIGRDCYLGLAHFTLSTYEYRHIASKAIPKSKQTWNDCVRRVENKIGSPVALEELD